MIQVFDPAAAVPISWSFPPLPISSTLPVPPLARNALVEPDGAQSTWSLAVEVTVVPVVHDSKLLSTAVLAHGKKLTSADTGDPVPKLQADGPVGSPHQLFFAVATEKLRLRMPSSLLASKLLLATVSFGPCHPWRGPSQSGSHPRSRR